MKTGITKNLTRRLIGPVMTIALAASLATYEFAKPAFAKGPVAAPTATPLDDNSIGALLSLDQAMETLAARVTPAVVNVAVTSHAKAKMAEGQMPQMPEGMPPMFGPFFEHPGRPQSKIEHGIGSGILISPDGYIVTNNHVVDGAVDINVTLNDRRILPAKLVGADPLTDLAVIKVAGTNLPNAPWGNSIALRPGQTVLAFGNPFGFRFTVTRGIVSGLNRPNPFSRDRRQPGSFIQTDAAINHGNSGGPLVNARCEAIGINTFLISSSDSFSGMGFAIPTQLVRPTLEALIRDGKVQHGYMGIGISDVTPENAKFFRVDNNEGALIERVQPGSAADNAGLQRGDVIVEVNRKPVENAADVQKALSSVPKGQDALVLVWSNGGNTFRVMHATEDAPGM